MKTLAFVWLMNLMPSPSPSPEPPSVARMVVSDGKPALKVYTNGDVWWSPTIKLNEASQIFWACIDEHNPLRPELKRLQAENAQLRAQLRAQCKK